IARSRRDLTACRSAVAPVQGRDARIVEVSQLAIDAHEIAPWCATTRNGNRGVGAPTRIIPDIAQVAIVPIRRRADDAPEVHEVAGSIEPAAFFGLWPATDLGLSGQRQVDRALGPALHEQVDLAEVEVGKPAVLGAALAVLAGWADR